MSIQRCEYCQTNIDTDFNAEHFQAEYPFRCEQEEIDYAEKYIQQSMLLDEQKHPKNELNLDDVRTVAILGDRHTGKTNLAFSLIKGYEGKKQIVMYAYPKDLGYKQIYSLEELAQLTDSIVFMDELQKHIKFYNKRTNDDFLDLLAVLAHNNNVLIFTTPMSQFITKSLDVFIDCFTYTKMLDLGVLKNGSKAKRWLQSNSFQEVTKWGVNLEVGEYLLISDKLRGKFTFPDMKVGKDWGKR